LKTLGTPNKNLSFAPLVILRYSEGSLFRAASLANTDRTLRSPGYVGILIAWVMLLAGSVGCHDTPDARKGRDIGPSKQAAAAPVERKVPLDPKLREAAAKELQTAFQSVDPEVRAHAVEGLQKGSGAWRDQTLLGALSDPDPLVRYAACLGVGQLQMKAAHDTVLSLADDKDPAVRVVARYALHRIGDYRYSHELEKLSRDPEARVRGTTAMVLGMIGDPSAIKVLHGMRIDPHPAVRQQAAAAMWQLGSEQGMKDLIGWSLSRFPDDQMMAMLSLAEPRNRQIIQHVRIGLVADWTEVKLASARAMGLLGSDEGYDIAAKGARSTDAVERIEASMAFGAIGRSDAQDTLQKLLHDTDANVRVAAAEAILELKSDNLPN
jgi:HEAT repeat protein